MQNLFRKTTVMMGKIQEPELGCMIYLHATCSPLHVSLPLGWEPELEVLLAAAEEIGVRYAHHRHEQE